MSSKSFDRFAGTMGILAGIFSFAFAVFFFIVRPGASYTGNLLSDILLLLTGFFIIVAFASLYHRLRASETGYSHLTMLLGVLGGLGMMVRGGEALAAVVMPGINVGPFDTVSAIDPRGLLMFLTIGAAVMIGAWAAARLNLVPGAFSAWGYLLSIGLVWTYVAYLITGDIFNLWTYIPALIVFFVLIPIWFIWLGTLEVSSPVEIKPVVEEPVRVTSRP